MKTGRTQLGRYKRGFTLIELTVAMAILSILIGMVSMLSYNYLSLSSEMVVSQREEMRTQAFLDWIRRTFGNLPGNAVWQITSNGQQAGSAAPLISDIIVQELPLTLYWSDSPIQIKAVRLRTLSQPNGLLKLELECYDEELLDLTSSEDNTALLDVKPIATTTLLEDVRWCEWSVRDPGTDEWKEDLKRNDNRPYQLQLNLAFGDNVIGIREVFWIPPKENPKLLIQEMKAGNMRKNSGKGEKPSGDSPSPSPSPEPSPPAPPSGGAATTSLFPAFTFPSPAETGNIKREINVPLVSEERRLA